jgi:SAM-dependent methyltransferase
MSDNISCRFCGGTCQLPALLSYPESPRSAQGFLDSPQDADEVVDLHIYQCGDCGLVQHDLDPVGYYRDVIRAIAFSQEMAQYRLGQLSAWISRWELTDKRVLEIGSGKGEYLELLARSGAQNCSGLENSPSSVAFAQERGLDVRPGYLGPDFVNPWPFEFDAFAIFSFMEHWPDLRGSLRALRGLLNEGAYGLVEVPSFDFVLANGLYSEFTVDHIFYFDQTSLRNVLEMCGFEVIEISSVWHDYILSAQVRKRRTLNTEGFRLKQERIVRELNAFVDRFAPHEVLVWGAGHQALAVMSLAHIRGRISHVLDSASFKQNKYTPGTRLLIKAPESLLTACPKAVVIMAAAYSGEVLDTLNQRYPSVKNIAILRENSLEVVKGGH